MSTRNLAEPRRGARFFLMPMMIVTVALCAPGCFVDLERDELVLRIFVDGASAEAREVLVSVSDSPDLNPFQQRFELVDVARADEPGSQALPDISVLTASVTVAAQTIDASGQRLDEEVAETIELLPGVTGLTLDFSAPALPPPQAGITSRAVEVSSEQTVDTEPAGTPWVLSIPIDPTAWSTALARLSSELGGPPESLELLHVSVFSGAVGDDDEATFDEIWRGRVIVAVRGGSVDATVGDLDAQDINQQQWSGKQTVLTEWLTTLPSDAEVVLTGNPASDIELPVRLTAVVEVVGRRMN